MNYQIITTTPQLEIVCEQAKQQDVLMLDTEFVRTRTYYPQLGLIQLYDGENLALIDPIAIEDMTAFEDLLRDTSILKVLHACGEDLEVFQNSFGCLPHPMVDTQIMAAFLGNGLSTGFAKLVEENLGVALDKSESRTDWLKRPLSDKQLDYAAADVYYLLPLYQKLLEQVTQAGWWEAVQQESDLIANKRVRQVEPTKAYLDIKGAWQLKPNQLVILKALAMWRYKEAIKRDLALNFVFKEHDLLAVAKYKIQSKSVMEKEGFDPRAIQRHGSRIITMVKTAMTIHQDEYPAPIERLMDKPSYKQQFKTLKDEVKKVSQKSGLATEFLASKKQLNQLISWVWKKDRDPANLPDLMQGWRLPLLGEKLDKLVK
ncbi:ribonuclease D [Vibrio sonorensis]|uniref:ribonuclease D n=1 Tax=Vibrio sonorensis TaxID=1004316 RepID=UPI0008D9FD53|nr:ribonuclease D [Vibrio sonorensis]